MRTLRRTMAGLVLLMAVVMVPGTVSKGQVVPPSQQTPGSSPLGRTNEPDPLAERMRQQQAIARTTERQKKLVADTNKLLELATELKTDVDKTNKDVLSVDVIKKADEIEKLAHSVKERMKG